MATHRPQPVIVSRGTGRELSFLGVTHKLTPADTGGEYYLFEAEFDPESGNRLHVHSREDEVVHVLEGRLQVRCGGETLHVERGGVAHLPRRIPHALYNPGKRPLKILAVAVPGGLECFFDELASAHAAGSLDEATHAAISREYGIEWLE